jgi:hypothetical protein
MSKRAKELLQRVATWPEEDLEKLEAAARQIEAWRSGLYEASEEELRAIDEAIAELDREWRQPRKWKQRSDRSGTHEARVRSARRARPAVHWSVLPKRSR